MQSIQPLLKLWRKWFNRNKLFKTDEMNELESHLLDEIDYIKEHDKLSEEQTFQKAVQLIGQRESLDKEYDKNHGFTYPKFVFWFRNHTLQLFVASLLIIVFLVADFQFSQSHTIGYNMTNNFGTEIMNPIFVTAEKPDIKFLVELNEPLKTIEWNVSRLGEDNKSIPLLCSQFVVFGKAYIAVLDDQNHLWFENQPIFKPNSLNLRIDSPKNWADYIKKYKKEVIDRSVQIKTIGKSCLFIVKHKERTPIMNDFFQLPLADEDFLFDQLEKSSTQSANTRVIIQPDKAKMIITVIQFYEWDASNPCIKLLADRFHNGFTFPQLDIRSYQLERRPLHILPYLYQQISLRLFPRVTPE